MELKQNEEIKWHSIVMDFQNVSKVALAAINHVANTQTDERGKVSEKLMLGNILTAMSLNQLLEPIPCGSLPALVAPDPFSVGILARAIAETRLILYSITRESHTISGANLRILWWKWHEICERIRTRDLIKSRDPKAAAFDPRKASLAKAIREHPGFQSLPSDLKGGFEKGKRP